MWRRRAHAIVSEWEWAKQKVFCLLSFSLRFHKYCHFFFILLKANH
jgi:hypothetical protein